MFIDFILFLVWF